VPWVLRRLIGAVPHTGRVVVDTAVAQLQGSAGIAALSLASIIASFSLMVAMAIMVHSFRDSFELWLVKLLPADLQLRLQPGSDTGAFSEQEQARIAALPGIARSEFRRVRQVLLRADREPVALIARELTAANAAEVLPLVRTAALPAPQGARPAWISEAVQDLYGYQPGTWLELPLAAGRQRFYIAGVWRDYARTSGAVIAAPPRAPSGSSRTGMRRRSRRRSAPSCARAARSRCSLAPSCASARCASSIACLRSPTRSRRSRS
jgi:putative ABC transport system permease protein